MKYLLPESKTNILSHAEAENKKTTYDKGSINVFLNKDTSKFTFYLNLLWDGDVYLGESYVNEVWSVHEGDYLHKFLLDILSNMDATSNWKTTIFSGVKHIFKSIVSHASISRSEECIDAHYNNGVELFRSFLCPNMVYTAALWNDGEACLEDAQVRKVNRILDLAKVVEGTKMLEFGCGYGFLSHVAAVERKASFVTALCNCKDMVGEARKQYGKNKNIKFLLKDYRNAPKTSSYDAIVSVEMIEAVPFGDYPVFSKSCFDALRHGGVVVIQCIHAYPCNNNVANGTTKHSTFVTKHIFPESQIVHLEKLHSAFFLNGFSLEYVETSGTDYAKTLRAWRHKLELNEKKISRKTFLKYQYYLAWCEACFDNGLLYTSRVVYKKK